MSWSARGGVEAVAGSPGAAAALKDSPSRCGSRGGAQACGEGKYGCAINNSRAFHGPGHLSRVESGRIGCGEGDPNRTVRFETSWPDPFRLFPTRESETYLLARPDSAREVFDNLLS